MTQRKRPAPPQDRPISNTHSHHQERHTHSNRSRQRTRTYGEARRPPISLCGCIRADIHDCEPQFITAGQADAAAATAQHLLLLGTPGIFDDETCRAMWRCGHRSLAAHCFSYSYGEVVA